MSGLIVSYLPVLVFFVVALFMAIAGILISWLVIGHSKDDVKNKAYECGFDSFEEPRNSINIRYYLVAILFIIFDIEIAFFFPWALALKEISMFGFYSMIAFLAVLTVGFVYEWKKGALQWS
jgi:NADH-quinone oxidoreductase subunit A